MQVQLYVRLRRRPQGHIVQKEAEVVEAFAVSEGSFPPPRQEPVSFVLLYIGIFLILRKAPKVPFCALFFPLFPSV